MNDKGLHLLRNFVGFRWALAYLLVGIGLWPICMLGLGLGQFALLGLDLGLGSFALLGLGPSAC